MGKLLHSQWKIFQDFCAWTSTNALPHVGLSDGLIIRIIWLLIFLGALAGFIYQLVWQLCWTYFQYPTNVDTTIEYGTRTFPAVTYCSLNPWKVTNISGTPLEDMVSAYASDVTAPKYGFTSPSTAVRQQRAMKWTQLMYENLREIDDQTDAGLSYTYDDLFIQCTYRTFPCNETDFTPFYDPFYGQCFTFNADGTYKTSRASPNYGLRVILRVSHKWYLPWVTSSGVVVAIHKQNTYPFAESKGWYVPSGKDMSFGIRSLTKKKLPKPYSNCKDVDNKDQYDTEQCIRNCIQAKIIKDCKCYDPSYGTPSQTSITSCYDLANANAAVDCILSIEHTDGSNGFNVNTECDCPQKCTEEYYKIAASNAIWPAKKYKPSECILDVFAPANSSNRPKISEWNDPPQTSEPVQVTCNTTTISRWWKWWKFGGWTTNTTTCNTVTTTTAKPTTTEPPLNNIDKALKPCKNWYDENTLMSEVYFEQVNFMTNEESPAYTLLQLISDIGGQSGFWLGTSIISLIEFLTWIAISLCFCCCSGIFKYDTGYEDPVQPKKSLIYKDNNLELPPQVQNSGSTFGH